jgi:hypothetical protein
MTQSKMPVSRSPQATPHSTPLHSRTRMRQDGRLARVLTGARSVEHAFRNMKRSSSEDPGPSAAFRQFSAAVKSLAAMIKRTQPLHDRFLALMPRPHVESAGTTPIPGGAESAQTAPPDEYSNWWRQTSQQSVAAYLEDSYRDLEQGVQKFTWCTPRDSRDPQNFGKFYPSADAVDHEAGKVYLCVSEHLVVKVYCIGVAGQQVKDAQLRQKAASAFMDASATYSACFAQRWSCSVFGLICQGTAYVCITRHKLVQWQASSQEIGIFLHQLALASGVVDLDGHFNNCGFNPLTGRVEVIDFERVARCDAAHPPPPIAHFTRYAHAIKSAIPDEINAIMEHARRVGLDATHTHFRSLVKGGRMFQTAFDGDLFARVPASSWHDMERRAQ